MNQRQRIFTVFTDGGARGNPGPAGIGVVIELDGTVLAEAAKNIGTATNNVAEYEAILEAYRKLSEQHLRAGDRINFLLDSLLVVQQLNGVFRVKDEQLKKRLFEIRGEEQKLAGVYISYTHIGRGRNKRADGLVNMALDGREK